MNREDIIKLANDMAFMACIWIDDEGDEINDVVKFAQLVAAAEREACAKVCDDVTWEGPFKSAAVAMSNLIRARGQQ